jgi:hypothetical protein
MVASLDFQSALKKTKFVEAHQMNIPENLVSIVQVVSVKKCFKTKYEYNEI